MDLRVGHRCHAADCLARLRATTCRPDRASAGASRAVHLVQPRETPEQNASPNDVTAKHSLDATAEAGRLPRSESPAALARFREFAGQIADVSWTGELTRSQRSLLVGASARFEDDDRALDDRQAMRKAGLL